MRDFNHSVNVLVKAYLDNTLVKALCSKCAVGNLIAEGDPNYNFYKHYESWYRACGLSVIYPNQRNPDHPDIIKTGYTLDELREIEQTFMNTADDADDPMFSSLMAVVDVLAEIHGIDLTVREESKKLFAKVTI